jgi:hypothetical protein
MLTGDEVKGRMGEVSVAVEAGSGENRKIENLLK